LVNFLRLTTCDSIVEPALIWRRNVASIPFDESGSTRNIFCDQLFFAILSQISLFYFMAYTMAAFGERALSAFASFYPCFTSNER